MQFTRRKQDALCLNGGNYSRPVPVNKTCDCAVTDVECDYGWVRNDKGECQQLSKVRLRRFHGDRRAEGWIMISIM
jgi:hypothetical protein